MPFGMGFKNNFANNDEVDSMRKKIDELQLPEETKRIVD